MKQTFAAKTYAANSFASGHWRGVGTFVHIRGYHLDLEDSTGSVLLEDGSYLLLESSVLSYGFIVSPHFHILEGATKQWHVLVGPSKRIKILSGSK